jgi:hypothetical protein
MLDITKFMIHLKQTNLKLYNELLKLEYIKLI